jgi:hypothetical protein
MISAGGIAPMGRNATQLQHKSAIGTGNLDGNFNEGPEIENLINKLSQSQINKG